MRRSIKIIAIIIIILIALTITAAHAQTQDIGQKLMNIGAFFSALIDADNTFNYISDQLEDNQCRKRDLFALHAQKDSIGDYILDNYRTINNQQLATLEHDYTLLTGELTFVRNIGEASPSQIRNAIIEDLIDDIPEIQNEITVWEGRYANRSAEYLNCRTSWTDVEERAKNLVNKLKTISDNFEALKTQFTATSEELIGIPEGFADNLARQAENARFGPTLTDLRTADEYRENALARLFKVRQRRSLAEILETERSLTVIPEILREEQQEFDLRRLLAVLQAQTDTTYSFTDSSAFVLWNDAVQMNNALRQTTELLANEQEGLNALSEEISDRQCR